ncbi:MAG: protein-glutamate O-methyltransferase CheR [Oceanicoccus sp.]|uniref:CheR family methyltransferase n=1 Tax=Oceanicoccus sp. TaxID=2691044 RepID=UPI002602EA36|nr:protein-glutamate O-methyltransferase CheR [Oceanicoccus sp.]MCP3906496.1 protein-glutamate O-methyltransferase CheR [Oceanicoccus sp.]MDG1772718.1 protein-glutamate O-methyltransferase CheR [Oceanicoccus sp.]
MSTWSYKAAPELSDEQYARWQSLLEKRTGICFMQHKSILQKGLRQRMSEVGAEDYEQYFQQVSAIPDGVVEWAQLIDKISVKETSFFRDSYACDVVRDFLLQRVAENTESETYPLDIWSVGCSTGEEAYSLAMLASEVIDYLAVKKFLGVMATDISQTALMMARRGVYSERKLENLPLAIKNKYFVENKAGDFQISPTLRQRIYFVPGNMLEIEQAPKLVMDVIFCQNVLVYFRRERQWQVLNALTEHLKPGGLLIIGPGEVIGWQHPQMQRSGDDKAQAYIKREVTN